MFNVNADSEIDISKRVLIIIGALLILLAGGYVFKRMSYNEPHQTIVYCLDRTTEDAESLRKALKAGAEQNRLTITDRGAEVASEMDTLNRTRPETVIHGIINRGDDLILSYSNLGTNGRTFHLSFYSKDYHSISESFDKAIRQFVTPRRTETFAGGSFDGRICVDNDKFRGHNKL